MLSQRWSELLDGFRAAVDRRAGGPDALGPDRTAALDALVTGWTGPAAAARLREIDTALATLGANAGLSAYDADLLGVLVAADLDPAVAVLLDLLSPAPGSTRVPTVGGVHELLGVPAGSAPARAALGPAGRLRAAGLLRVEGTGPWWGRRLVTPDRVLAHLQGDPTPEPSVAALVVRGELPARLDGVRETAAAWAGGETFVWIRGGVGSAGASVVAQAATAVGRPAVVVRLTGVPPEAQASVLESAIVEAVLRGAVLGVLEDGGWGARTRELDLPTVIERLRASPGPVAVVSSLAWDPGWAPWLPVAVEAPQLTREQRAGLWAEHLDQPPDESDPGWADLVALRVAPEEAAAVASLVRAEDGRVSVERLREATRRLTGRGSPVPRARASFDDLVLPSEVAGGLRQLVSWARHRDEVLAQGPLMGKGGKGTGITALFTGSPGTGKTLAAHVIAEELGLDLYQVDLAGVVDKYIGETEKNLEAEFAAAERLNCVLFFDEADSLFGSRSEVRDSRDRYANLEVSYLLQRMEQFDGIAVLATNLRGNLDVAFSRRLHFVLHFPDPDVETRETLWRQHLRHVAVLDAGDPVDVAHLARVAEIAGGDIRNAVLAAAYAAAEDGGGLGMRHVVAGLEREYRKLGRRVPDEGMGPPRPRTPTATTRRTRSGVPRG